MIKKGDASLSIVFVLMMVAVSYGQRDVPVTRLVADNHDGVRISVSVRRPMIDRGEDIVIDCTVNNNGKAPITWLDSIDGTEARVVDLGLIRVYSAFQYVEDHFPVKYKYIRLLPGRTLKRLVRIPAKVYLEDKKYAFEDATIQMAFTYILGNKPYECDDTHWPRPCLFAVSKVARTVSIGMLQIDIKEKVENKRQ